MNVNMVGFEVKDPCQATAPDTLKVPDLTATVNSAATVYDFAAQSFYGSFLTY